MQNITTSLDGHFPPLLSDKSAETHLGTANHQQGIPIHAPVEQGLASLAINIFEDGSLAALGPAQTTLETPARSSEGGIISIASAEEEAVNMPAAPPSVVPSHLQYPESVQPVPIPSPFPSPSTTSITVVNDDSSTIKTKESKSRPRNVQKESFAARHRIQVEIPCLPTSESSSLVHRTRRGRPSIGSIGIEFSTKFPDVPPPAPVDPRPAARRARQRKRNSNGDENYGGSEKKFKCEYCGQTFGRKEHVKRHERGIHQQIKGKTLLDLYTCLLTCPPQRINATSVECVVLALTTSDNICGPTSEMDTSHPDRWPFLCYDTFNNEHPLDGILMTLVPSPLFRFSRTPRAFPSSYYPCFACTSFVVLLLCCSASAYELLYAFLPFLMSPSLVYVFCLVCLCLNTLRTSFTVRYLNLLHIRVLPSDASGWTCAVPDTLSGSRYGRYRDSQLLQRSDSVPRSGRSRVLVSPHLDHT